MIVAILLILLLTGEIVFYVWNRKEQRNHIKEKAFYRIILTFCLSALLLTGVLDGLLRYAGLVIVLLIQAILFLVYRKRKESTHSKSKPIRNVVLNLFLYVMALSFAILFPQYQEPRITGDLRTLTKEFTWVDKDRVETYSDTGENRAVTVKFWYPEEKGCYPLVIFSHGATGMLESNTSLYEELSSNGYVVAAISHTYQSLYTKDVNSGKITVIDSGFMEQVMTNNGSDSQEHEKAVFDMSREWLKVRCGDMNFVLDTILTKTRSGDPELFSNINPEEIGLCGHSLGGATSVMLGRQRSDIDAVIDLEGTMFGEYTGYENGEYICIEEPYPIPLLDVNSRAIYEEATSYDDREYVNFTVGKNAKDFREVVFNDAGHLNFTDLPLVSPFFGKMLGSGNVDARTCTENVNEMVLHYFNFYLKNAPELDIEDEY